MSRFTLPLQKLNKEDILLAGGKGANLGELIKIGVPVPPGFVILVSAFEKFLEETDINVKIDSRWRKINVEDIESVEESSEILRDLIVKARIPEEINKEILESFKKLKTKYVAVRSSATAEDSKINSWAGELESYLNTTKENLIKNVKKCWASLFSPRAIFYRARRNLGDKKISIGAVIQKMVQSKVSGVCFTVHPVTEDKNQIVIEAIQGLGEALVQGKVTPDSYVIEKDNLKILDINIPPKEKQKLSEKQIKELVKLCMKIENHYKNPQDIEWARKSNKFYILQTRPITVL